MSYDDNNSHTMIMVGDSKVTRDSPQRRNRIGDRAGVVGEWEHDVRNPRNWSGVRKCATFMIVNLVMFAALLNATSITSATTEISTAFSISTQPFPHTYWPITSWTLAAAFFPLPLVPLTEDLGVRPGCLLLYLLSTLFIIPQALSQNFATLIISRVFSGGFAASFLAVVDVVVVDLWADGVARLRAVAVYTFLLLAGYTLGPAFGSGVLRVAGWRWILWVQVILNFVCLGVLAVGLGETRGEVVVRKIQRRAGEKSGSVRMVGVGRHEEDPESAEHVGEVQVGRRKWRAKWQLAKESVIRPTHMLVTEPVLASFTLWSGFTTGVLFTFTQSTAQVYTTLYNWGEYRTGIIQIAVFMGQIAGLALCLASIEYIHWQNTSRKPQQQLPLEAHLYITIPTTLLGLAGGLFIYAWTAYPSLPWIAPTTGLFLVGMSSMCIVTAVDIYITDSYARFAGSAIAMVAFGENVFAAFLPLASLSMYTNLGFQWASSLLGFLGLAMVAIPVVLVWKGESVRHRSRFINSEK